MFDEALSEAELSAWRSLKSVVTNFLGNHWSAEYKKEIEELLKSFHLLGAQMSVKLHFLLSLLDYFPRNWKFECRAGQVLSLRHSHYGRALPRPVLVLKMESGDCQTQEEVSEKTFHPWIANCVFFSLLWHNVSFL